MADETVRNLERRWRDTQTPQDLSAWLRARQQSGELSQVRLRLAARLGSAVARELVGLDSPEPLRQLGSWWDTVQQLVRSTGLGAAEARARFVLTGKAGPGSRSRCSRREPCQRWPTPWRPGRRCAVTTSRG